MLQQSKAPAASRTLIVLGGVIAVSYGSEILAVRAGIIRGGLYLDWINGLLIAMTFSAMWYAGIRAAAHQITAGGREVSVISTLWPPAARIIAASAGLLSVPGGVAVFLWFEPTDGKGFAALTGLFCIVVLMAVLIGTLANGYRSGLARMDEVKGFGDAACVGLLILTIGFPVFYAIGPFLIFGGGLLIAASVHHVKVFRNWGILAGAAGCIVALRNGAHGSMPEPAGSYYGLALALISVVIGAMIVRRRQVKRGTDHE